MSLPHVDAFAALLDRPLRGFSGTGPRVGRAWSPGPLDRNPVDEDHGWPAPSALRAAGWPLSDDMLHDDPAQLFAELPVLPWIGHINRYEADDFLTIDGMSGAAELLIEPEAGTPFFGLSWRAGVRLVPGRWLAMSIFLRGDTYQQPSAYAAVYLAVWVIEGQEEDRGVLVLPHGEAYRQGYRRILGITQADLDAALEDDIRGSLRF